MNLISTPKRQMATGHNENVPAGHASGVGAPSGQNEPAWHGTHAYPLPTHTTREPGAQKLLALAAAGHTAQEVAPTTGLKVPLAHARQAVAPWLATKVPMAHDAHAVALASENEPAKHKAGAETAGGQANPARHGEGTMAPDRINGWKNNHTFATTDQAQPMPSSRHTQGAETAGETCAAHSAIAAQRARRHH